MFKCLILLSGITAALVLSIHGSKATELVARLATTVQAPATGTQSRVCRLEVSNSTFVTVGSAPRMPPASIPARGPRAGPDLGSGWPWQSSVPRAFTCLCKNTIRAEALGLQSRDTGLTRSDTRIWGPVGQTPMLPAAVTPAPHAAGVNGDRGADIAWNAKAQALREGGSENFLDLEALSRGNGRKLDIEALAQTAIDAGCRQVMANGKFPAALQPQAAHSSLVIPSLAAQRLFVVLVRLLDPDSDLFLALLGQHIGAPFLARRRHAAYLGTRGPAGGSRHRLVEEFLSALAE